MSGLLNKTDSGITKMEVYLDLKNKMMHIGDQAETSIVNKTSGFINYPSDGQNWIIRIRDVRYNSTMANYSSLNDTFTRRAIIDTMFPGISVPSTLWPNVERYLLQSMSIPGAQLACNYTDMFMMENYSYCAFNKSCNWNQLADISL